MTLNVVAVILKMMNITTNQDDKSEQDIQVNALSKALKFYGDEIG